MTTSPVTLIPRQAVPALEVPIVDGGRWNLSAQRSDTFELVVFYRGLHCPLCAKYLADLESRLAEFSHRGIGVIAISTDSEERAAAAKAKWRLPDLAIGYGLELQAAWEWGLRISTGRDGSEEPKQFAEPGLFLIRPDGTLYLSSIQTMPFARPHLDELIKGIDFVVKSDYPARGEVSAI